MFKSAMLNFNHKLRHLNFLVMIYIFSSVLTRLSFLLGVWDHISLLQLMHEVKELRAYGIENSTKICYLEEKLVSFLRNAKVVVWIFIGPSCFHW